MQQSSSGKWVILGVFFIIILLISGYHFLTNNDSPIQTRQPAHFGLPKDTTAVTVMGASLGRQLFNDVLLSRNKTISCASCHQQTASYADAEKKFSIGDRGLSTKRNAPVLVNLIYKEHFFADGRASRLEETILNAIHDPLELDTDMETIIARIQQHPHYNKKYNVYSIQRRSSKNIS